MMKSNALWMGLLVLSMPTLYAQESQEIKEQISDVKAPSAPASVIIGSSPSSINRPKSWEALEVGLFNNFTNDQNSFVVPNDFALEFSPYWARDSVHLTTRDFLFPNAWTSVKQNFSFSVSSTQNFVLNDTNSTNAMGFGLRTMLWQGAKKEIQVVMNAYSNTLKGFAFKNRVLISAQAMTCDDCDKGKFIRALKAAIDTDQDRIYAEMSDGSERTSITKALIVYLKEHMKEESDKSKLMGDLADQLDTFLGLDDNVSKITKLRADRKGFKLELAGALATNFPTNQTDYSVVSKWGVWLTPSYELYNTDWIEFLGVARYFWYNTDFFQQYLPGQEYYESTMDYGARIVFKWKKSSLEFEGAGRTAQVLTPSEEDPEKFESGTKSDFQYVLNFNYQINDRLALSYDFGKRFEPVLTYNGTVISLLSLNIGLGAPNTKEVQGVNAVE